MCNDFPASLKEVHNDISNLICNDTMQDGIFCGRFCRFLILERCNSNASKYAEEDLLKNRNTGIIHIIRRCAINQHCLSMLYIALPLKY